MAVREPRRQPTPNERVVADRVRRARPARRDLSGQHHAAIAELGKSHNLDVSWLLDLWDEQVSARAYQGETGPDAEQAAFDDLAAIVAMVMK